MEKSVPPVTVWHHLAEPGDTKTMTLGTDLSIRTSHSCQILILSGLHDRKARGFGYLAIKW